MNLEKLRQYREEILTLAWQYHSANIRVFGSVARGEATETSDIDLLLIQLPNRIYLILFVFLVLSKNC